MRKKKLKEKKQEMEKPTIILIWFINNTHFDRAKNKEKTPLSSTRLLPFAHITVYTEKVK